MGSQDNKPDQSARSLGKMLDENGGNASPSVAAAESVRRAQRAAARRANIAVALIPVLVIIITFLFWYQTWFGRALSASEMNQYLTDTSVPHKTQHALSQLADEIQRRDPNARRWYPQILALAANSEPQFRMISAWVMGQDNQSAEFHQALKHLLADPEPMVRRNAALALVRFGDASGQDELRRMLRPCEVAATSDGKIEFRLKESDEVARNLVVARIASPGGETVEVHSPVEGVVARLAVADGSKVAAGQAILVLSPSESQVWESLRALFLVGGRESLADIEPFERAVPGMSERVRRQATLTVMAIQKRAAGGQ